MNRRRGLATRAKRTEWQRLVAPSHKPGAGKATRKFMVIRPSRESTSRWTWCWKATRATSHLPLNEHGWALNAFGLPGDRKEGVRGGQAKAFRPQTDSAPGTVGTRWHQMGDGMDHRPGGRNASKSKRRNDRKESRLERRLPNRKKTKTAFRKKGLLTESLFHP